jgi:hypothetical protein
MKFNHTPPGNKQFTRFDKELKAILLHDLKKFQQARGRFLRNSSNSKQANENSLLVA